MLEQIFATRDLDFISLFSSTSAIWGRVGQVDYTAANAYLDAWAAGCLDRSKWPVVSINWDNWREVGMAINTLRLAPGQDKSSAIKTGLTTAEGIRAFDEALVARHTQVIVRGAPPAQWKAQGGARAALDGPGLGRGRRLSLRRNVIRALRSLRRIGRPRRRWRRSSSTYGPNSC